MQVASCRGEENLAAGSDSWLRLRAAGETRSSPNFSRGCAGPGRPDVQVTRGGPADGIRLGSTICCFVVVASCFLTGVVVRMLSLVPTIRTKEIADCLRSWAWMRCP
ncbi:hypothetical protein NDU88_004071 [Pleurodeles waltl]|uniref:Uncharacterized protein n=1 Tax=Pleurodeles waltl TaxID=8319 RepID=A0AAV7WR87_PLEWA|nr:hypothetical protein NDU88_004071 [Pleurodeles waltl]